MIGRRAGSVRSSASVGERRTRMLENSGAQRAMGSSRAKRPSSNSINAAAEVIGFDIEAMRKMVSRSMGRAASISRQPTQALCTTLPPRQTSVTAPANSPA